MLKSWAVADSVDVKALLLDSAFPHFQQCNLSAIGKPLKTRELVLHEVAIISRIREARETLCWILERRFPCALLNHSLTALEADTDPTRARRHKQAR
jgi:hypothetical protein